MRVEVRSRSSRTSAWPSRYVAAGLVGVSARARAMARDRVSRYAAAGLARVSARARARVRGRLLGLGLGLGAGLG